MVEYFGWYGRQWIVRYATNKDRTYVLWRVRQNIYSSNNDMAEEAFNRAQQLGPWMLLSDGSEHFISDEDAQMVMLELAAKKALGT